MPLDQNPHQSGTRFGCVRFSMYACGGFLCPKCDSFACLHIRERQNGLHLKRWFFLPKSASSVSRSQAHLAKRKRIGWSIAFNYWTNWTSYDIIPMSLCKIHFNDVSEMFSCWEQRWIDVDGASHTLSVTAVIFSGVRTVFGFSRFGLSMRMRIRFGHLLANLRIVWILAVVIYGSIH